VNNALNNLQVQLRQAAKTTAVVTSPSKLADCCATVIYDCKYSYSDIFFLSGLYSKTFTSVT